MRRSRPSKGAATLLAGPGDEAPTTQLDTSPYPGSRPSRGGKTATPACLYWTMVITVQQSLPKAPLRPFLPREGSDDLSSSKPRLSYSAALGFTRVVASNWPTLATMEVLVLL